MRILKYIYVDRPLNSHNIMFCLNVLLNQARAGRRPARAWFLRIAFVREVSMRVWMCVCVSAPEAMNN